MVVNFQNLMVVELFWSFSKGRNVLAVSIQKTVLKIVCVAKVRQLNVYLDINYARCFCSVLFYVGCHHFFVSILIKLVSFDVIGMFVLVLDFFVMIKHSFVFYELYIFLFQKTLKL